MARSIPVAIELACTYHQCKEKALAWTSGCTDPRRVPEELWRLKAPAGWVVWIDQHPDPVNISATCPLHATP